MNILSLVLIASPQLVLSVGAESHADQRALTASADFSPIRLGNRSLTHGPFEGAFSLRLGEGAEGPELQTARLAGWAISWSQVNLRLLQLRKERSVPLAATTWLFDPIAVTWSFAGALAGPSLQLIARTEITFSIAQRTDSTLSLAPMFEPEMVWCGSGSLARAAAGLLIFERLELSAFTSLKGDPFHLGDGAACLGDAPVWTTRETAGARISIELFAGLSLSAQLEQQLNRLHVDLSPGAHEHADGASHDHSHVIVTERATRAIAITLALSV